MLPNDLNNNDVPLKVPVIIDSCAWNFFYRTGAILTELFPSEKFRCFQTSHIAIELQSIPDVGKDGSDKRALKGYIEQGLVDLQVKTLAFFGFASTEPDGSPSRIQTAGNFGHGTFMSDAQRARLEDPRLRSMMGSTATRSSGLVHDAADHSLVLHSVDSMIVTAEKRDKKGPIKLASEFGTPVLYLLEMEREGIALQDLVANVSEHWDEIIAHGSIPAGLFTLAASRIARAE